MMQEGTVIRPYKTTQFALENLWQLANAKEIEKQKRLRDSPQLARSQSVLRTGQTPWPI